jgi:hypothetical protein
LWIGVSCAKSLAPSNDSLFASLGKAMNVQLDYRDSAASKRALTSKYPIGSSIGDIRSELLRIVKTCPALSLSPGLTRLAKEEVVLTLNYSEPVSAPKKTLEVGFYFKNNKLAWIDMSTSIITE